jgi:hypothetical protein
MGRIDSFAARKMAQSKGEGVSINSSINISRIGLDFEMVVG